MEVPWGIILCQIFENLGQMALQINDGMGNQKVFFLR
jgi:hypothetical protein